MIPFLFGSQKVLTKNTEVFLLMRDRDGNLVDDDKAVWIQGRNWLLATLYNTVDKKQE